MALLALNFSEFDLEVAMDAQEFGIWACFSPGEGKLCNTKIKLFYFELLLFL